MVEDDAIAAQLLKLTVECNATKGERSLAEVVYNLRQILKESVAGDEKAIEEMERMMPGMGSHARAEAEKPESLMSKTKGALALADGILKTVLTV